MDSINLNVTKDGLIHADANWYDDTPIDKFLKKLDKDVSTPRYHYRDIDHYFEVSYACSVIKLHDSLYEIKDSNHYYTSNFDIGDAVLYYPTLKKKLDELANKTNENQHKRTIIYKFETGGGYQDTNKVKVYYQALLNYKMKLMLKKLLNTSPFSIPILLITLAVLFSSPLLGYFGASSAILSIRFLFEKWDDSMFSNDFFFPWRASKAIRRRIKKIKTLLKTMVKDNEGIESLKAPEVSKTKNDDISVFERMVVNAAKITYNTLKHVNDDTRIQMLRYLNVILDEYLECRKAVPKFAPKSEINACESKIAMEAIGRIQALNDRINELSTHNYDGMPELCKCSDVRDFIANQTTGEEKGISSGRARTLSIGQ